MGSEDSEHPSLTQLRVRSGPLCVECHSSACTMRHQTTAMRIESSSLVRQLTSSSSFCVIETASGSLSRPGPLFAFDSFCALREGNLCSSSRAIVRQQRRVLSRFSIFSQFISFSGQQQKAEHEVTVSLSVPLLMGREVSLVSSLSRRFCAVFFPTSSDS
jgi:hypothetical protein